MGAIDRLRKATETASKEVVEQKSKDIGLDIIKNIVKINLCETKEENEFLELKTKELLNVQANASIQLGKIMTEVSQKITEDITYCQWLELVGFNRMTALRHRRRYDLFQSVNNSIAKEIVASLTFREIEKIYKNLSENLVCLNTSKTVMEFKNILKNELFIEQKESKKIQKMDINFEIFSNIKEKVNQMDDKKKDEVAKLLLKIEKLLKD
ncbi:hypothetical protein [uncultured Cetobacterium sp.]|uniref:hypothetical protein n=1 Tax=uncultured Cetobacterium sp. TaxID=527638 RepID=UPI0026319E52|nr:hypothetical protein [uncultured Cetobacterium sp.]